MAITSPPNLFSAVPDASDTVESPDTPDTVDGGGGRPFVRAAHLREDRAWLKEQLELEQTRIVPLWRGKSFLANDEGGQGVRMATLAAPDFHALAKRATDEVTLIFLGLRGQVGYWAADVSHLDDPAAHPPLSGGRFDNLRSILMLWGGLAMDTDVTEHAGESPQSTSADELRVDAHILAYSKAMVHWHRQHRYCGSCGSATNSTAAGHRRRCSVSACGASLFPRTDTAMIVLVYDDSDRIILGRAPRHPPGMRSILAGFLEPGESLEDTVAREVFEEVGIQVDDVRYHSSQPWPFPGSLMVGFTAHAATLELQIDQEELEDAAWYEREQVLAMSEAKSLRIPPASSVAGRLIRAWLAQDSGTI